MVHIEWYSMTGKNKMFTIIGLICGIQAKSQQISLVTPTCLEEVRLPLLLQRQINRIIWMIDRIMIRLTISYRSCRRWRRITFHMQKGESGQLIATRNYRIKDYRDCSKLRPKCSTQIPLALSCPRCSHRTFRRRQAPRQRLHQIWMIEQVVKAVDMSVPRVVPDGGTFDSSSMRTPCSRNMEQILSCFLMMRTEDRPQVQMNDSHSMAAIVVRKNRNSDMSAVLAWMYSSLDLHHQPTILLEAALCKQKSASLTNHNNRPPHSPG